MRFASFKPRQRFLPRPEHVDLYRQVSETVFRHVRDATAPILHRSYPIFQ